MSKPVVYVWPSEDISAIATQQDVLNGVPFIIDGTYSNIGSGISQPYASFEKISRTVSVTSVLANDYSGVSFIISGTLNSIPVVEEIEGPTAATTVETTQLFDTVTSIITDADVNDVAIGSGTEGRTHWYRADYNRSVASMSLQINVTAGLIDYTFAATLDDVETVEEPITFDITGDLTGQTDSNLVHTSLFPINYCCLEINSSDETGSLIFTILEGGVV